MSEKKKFKLKIHFGKISAILIAVFVVLLTADLVLKYCEETYNWTFKVIPGLIYVESGSRNTGAAFSFLSDTEWGRIFFIVITFIMLIVMIAAFLLLPERFVGLKVALVMVAAGALGNLVDRLWLQSVRDFVWVNIFGSWACCNFADFWIVFGVIYAVIDILFINEWAVFPLTKTAKEAAKARELAVKQEKEELEQNVPTDRPQSQSAETAESAETVQTSEQPTDSAPDGGSGEE
ncbi:MAG: signal peptidase II [Clostridia bacterium]|nr:signal peptidase II [Clostridia bacterium]